MEFEELIKEIFNYIGNMTPSEIKDEIDRTFVKEEIVTPFGTIVIHKRRSMIDLIGKARENKE